MMIDKITFQNKVSNLANNCDLEGLTTIKETLLNLWQKGELTNSEHCDLECLVDNCIYEIENQGE